MKQGKLDAIWRRRKDPPPPKAFVETGTYYGKTTLFALALGFSPVHTIELSPVLAAKAAALFAGTRATVHHGDSRVIVPRLAAEIQEPVLWYLDAHGFNVPDVAHGPLPLLEELRAIATRTQPDIIAIDDAGDFGLDRISPEWLELSLEKVAAFFPGYREALVLFDQAVIYR